MDTSKKQLENFLNKNKSDHFNFQDTINWICPTGSLLFDSQLGGGYKPGAYKVNGASFAGKTHCVLNCIKNALDIIPKAKGLWIDAEGRLDKDIKERAGISFVYDASEWEVGTCFVLQTNIFETAINLINDLVKNNVDDNRYIMCIDSMDCLIRRDDESKTAEEAGKVGAAGLLTSLMFKKANLVLNKKGHCLFMINQLRSSIDVSQYTPKDQNASVGGGGTNAPVHAANQIWNFLGRTKSSTIFDGDTTLGHYCRIKISKGVQERTDVSISYPVRHGRKGGTSVWKEYEIIDLLLQWGFLEKKGSWINSDSELTKFLGEEFKAQGMTKTYQMLEEDTGLCGKMEEFCKENIFDKMK
jgi:RecA/RadA recombinase